MSGKRLWLRQFTVGESNFAGKVLCVISMHFGGSYRSANPRQLCLITELWGIISYAQTEKFNIKWVSLRERAKWKKTWGLRTALVLRPMLPQLKHQNYRLPQYILNQSHYNFGADLTVLRGCNRSFREFELPVFFASTNFRSKIPHEDI